MEDQFYIYIEQLRHGQNRKIEEVLDPAFLSIDEKELFCKAPVQIDGEAYLADHSLILHFSNISTEVLLPCSICNNLAAVSIHLTNVYHSELTEEIPTGIYNFKEMLRETILLEIPQFTECEGSCPARAEIAQYLKKDAKESKQGSEGYRPFADLDEDSTIKKKKAKQ